MNLDLNGSLFVQVRKRFYVNIDFGISRLSKKFTIMFRKQEFRHVAQYIKLIMLKSRINKYTASDVKTNQSRMAFLS